MSFTPTAVLRGSLVLGEFGKSPGRALGVRNRFSHAFLTDFLADWEQHGASAIKTVRLRDPSTYLRVAVQILPKEMLIEATISELSDPALDDFILAAAEHLALRPGEPMKLIGCANGSTTINGSAAREVIENADAGESNKAAARRRE